MRQEPYPDCPGEEIVREVAANIAPPELVHRTLQHAAQCDHCGPLLNSYLEAFSDEISPEIERLIQDIPSASTKAQRRKAREIAGRIPRPAPPPRLGDQIRAWVASAGLRPVVGGLVAVLVAAASFQWGPVLVAQWELHRENQRVAAAYAERRTTEMRLTAVDHGDYRPLPKTLGDNDGLDLQRPMLLSATSELSKKLGAGDKLDPQWLQIKGRLALLAGPGAAKTAEEAFEEARSQGLTDPSLDIDLAVSFFERGAAGDGLNLTRTIDLLVKVLKRPDLTSEQRAVALFDLSIAYEKIQAWDLAVANWKKYLAEDRSSGSWAKEARDHLRKAKEKLPPPKTSDFRRPAYLLRHSSELNVLSDIEQFQGFALAGWIVPAISNPSGKDAQSLALIAQVMERRHHDTWWKDFLSATGPHDLAAVQALSEAYVAGQNDLHFHSLEQSRRAAALFAEHHNRPGELMAIFQEVYALQRSAEGTNCLARSTRLRESLVHTNYRWLQGEVALERATCANLSSNFQLVDASLEESHRIAGSNHFDFPELRLRIIGLAASMLRLRGKYADAWKESVRGLGKYWAGAYSGERLYQFYTVMRQCAKNIDAINAAEALLRHSIHVFENDAPQDSTLRALLYLRLANLLLEENNAAGAEEEAVKARSLLGATRNNLIYNSAARIELASFELRRKEAARALAELKTVAAVASVQDIFLRLDFYETLGSAELQLNHLNEAMSAFEQAIRIADESFRAMNNGEGQLHWMRATNEIYSGVVQVLLAKKDDERALAVWEWARSRTFAGASGPRLAALLRISSPKLFHALSVMNQNRVVYASFEDRLHVWIVRGRRVQQSLSIPIKRSDLKARIRDFEKSCSSAQWPQPVKQETQSEPLYRLLLESVVTRLPPSQVIVIELDDAMAALPLEAVKSPEGWYFGEKYSFIYSPGLYAETALRAPSVLRSHDRVVAIDGSAADGDNYLPGHDTALDGLRQIQSQLELFPNPTTVAALRVELQRAAGLSFFGHAVPMGTGAALKLGPDSFLTARELSPGLLRKMQIVVLAACSSGAAGKGLLDSNSLVRAFLAGGVPTVVASRWNVESRSTAQFVHKFYSHLASESAADAMRDVRREMRSQQPYYWAGFSLTGRSN